MIKPQIAIFWYRRDLRLDDNTALNRALKSGLPVLPLFIFDTSILEDLSKDDARVTFIYQQLEQINSQFLDYNSSICIKEGLIKKVWQELLQEFNVKQVYFNKDYEPYAIQRDKEIITLLQGLDIEVYTFKDDVVFEENEVLKGDGTPYTVFTPYKNKWLLKTHTNPVLFKATPTAIYQNLVQERFKAPSLKELGFKMSPIKVRPYDLGAMDEYEKNRNFPAIDKTSYLSPHLRFGTVSIRNLVIRAQQTNPTFLSELIWREFFKVILFHHPRVVSENFKSSYNGIKWRNNEAEFKRWCQGKTGYPFVDAGMRQLNTTGFMHNRVRMVTASFLCKHLLIDWRWGEAYFAEKLLDYDLSSNNGNWQWAAGTGCDAAPYFRVFSPEAQQKKFDKNFLYIKKWIPEFETNYNEPMVEHAFARERALRVYKEGIQKG